MKRAPVEGAPSATRVPGSPDEKERAVQLRRDQLKSLKAIADDLERDPDTVSRWLRDAGLDVSYAALRAARTASLKEKAVQLRCDELMTIVAISERLDRSEKTIRRWLNECGVNSSRETLRERYLTIDEVEELHDVDRRALEEAVDAGRVRALRRSNLIGGAKMLFERDEIAADLAALPRCKYDGCGRPVLRSSGGCQVHGHVFVGPRARGIKRPDLGPIYSAALRGKPQPHSAARMRRSWEKGGGAIAKLVERWEGLGVGGAARRRLKLRWAPKPGRSRNDAHPEWGAVLEQIRELYAETNATERELMKLYTERHGLPDWGKPVSKRVVRIALGRPV